MSEPLNGAGEQSEHSEASVAKRCAAEQVSGVGGASQRTLRATEWPVQNAIVSDKKRPLAATANGNGFTISSVSRIKLPLTFSFAMISQFVGQEHL